MAVVGAWVSRQIENGVVHRTAANTALYVDSLIAPPLQDLSDGEWLSPAAVDRLDWLLEDTPLGREVAVFQVWDRDGHIVYSTEPALVGHQAAIAGDLRWEEGRPGERFPHVYAPIPLGAVLSVEDVTAP